MKTLSEEYLFAITNVSCSDPFGVSIVWDKRFKVIVLARSTSVGLVTHLYYVLSGRSCTVREQSLKAELFMNRWPQWRSYNKPVHSHIPLAVFDTKYNFKHKVAIIDTIFYISNENFYNYVSINVKKTKE